MAKKKVTLETLMKGIEDALETLNKVRKAKHTEEELTKAQKAVDESIKVYNTALRHEEFAKWLKAEDPILTALTQRDITQIATKKQTNRDTKETTIVLREKDVMVNLPEFDAFAVTKKGKHLFADVKADNLIEAAAYLFSDYIHKSLAVTDALTWETTKEIEKVDFTESTNLTVLLGNCMNAIHEGFEAEPADFEFARSVLTKKKSGYKGKGKGRTKACVMSAITGEVIWSIVTDIMAKAVNGYGYDLEAVTVKEEK